jgi:hypothetical protein
VRPFGQLLEVVELAGRRQRCLQLGVVVLLLLGLGLGLWRLRWRRRGLVE